VKRTALVALLLFATAIWGWSFVAVKEAVAVYGVVAFLALRFTVGSATLGVLAVPTFNKRTLAVGSVFGIVLAGGYYVQVLGLRYTTVTNSGFITSLFVITTPLINRVLFGVKIRPTFWLIIAFSLLGVYLLTYSAPASPLGGESSARAPDRGHLGDWLTLGAALLYGLHIALLDRYAKRHPPLTLAFAQTASAAVLFLLFWPFGEPLQWPSGSVWNAVIVTGVLATALCFAIQIYVQQRLSAVATTLLLTAEPVFAAFFGILLLGERLTAAQSFGIALMIAAIVAAQVGAGEHAAAYPLDPL
jgi:drug/metabolite transporter (DMT)-like permease